MFRAGTLNVSAAQSFSRGMQIDYVATAIQSSILERKGNFISRDQLLSKWVLDGASAYLIAEDLRTGALNFETRSRVTKTVTKLKRSQSKPKQKQT